VPDDSHLPPPVKVLGIIFGILVTIGGWVYGGLQAAAVHRIEVVETKIEKYEERINTNERGLDVIEVQLREINKKLDTLLSQH